jgi:hypothetical protein
VLLDSIVDPDVVRRARRLVDAGRADSGRAGSAIVGAYTQIDPATGRGALGAQIEDRVALLAEAGADSVILQGTGESPDPRPLIDALAREGMRHPGTSLYK